MKRGMAAFINFAMPSLVSKLLPKWVFFQQVWRSLLSKCTHFTISIIEGIVAAYYAKKMVFHFIIGRSLAGQDLS